MRRPLQNLSVSAMQLSGQWLHHGTRELSTMKTFNHDIILKTGEYLGLRAAILEWQHRRFLTIGFTITAFAIYSNQIIQDDLTTFGAAMRCVVFSIYLSVVWAFIVYAGAANVRLSTYIQIFHEQIEPGPISFETRLEQMKANTNEKSSLDKIIKTLFIISLLFANIGMLRVFINEKNYLNISLIQVICGAIASMVIFFTTMWACKKWLTIDRDTARTNWRNVTQLTPSSFKEHLKGQ